MSGSLTVAVAHQGSAARLVNVTCTHGRHDRPFAEVHEEATWTVALVRRGTFRYRAASTNGKHALRPGWLLLGRPEAEYECSHDEDGGDECASLTLSREVLADVASGVRGARSLVTSPPVLPPSSRVAALVERARRQREGDLDVDELAYDVAEAVSEHLGATRATDVARHPTHVDRVHGALARIEASCREPLSLAALADDADLSPFHFLRVFRRVTGTTPHQYLLGARLRLAVRLLLDTRKPVTEIAYDVGFQDLSNFVRTFHRAAGCAPGVFRRSGAATEPARSLPGGASPAEGRRAPRGPCARAAAG